MIASKVAEFETVHIVIPSKLLLERDKKKFAHFFEILQINPSYHSDLRFPSDPKSLLLIALVARTINTQPVLVFCEQTCYQELQSANLNPRLIDDDPDF